MKLLYVVLVLVLVGSATTTTYFTYYTATFYTTDIFQLENKVASLESEISSLKNSIESDLNNAYDDGYAAGIAEQSSSSNSSSSKITSSNTDPASTTRTIDTVEKSGYSTDCAVLMGGDGCYTPVILSANVGDKIMMINADSTGVHTFTSGIVNGFTPNPDGIFDTGVLMSGDSFEWTPTETGEYPYYCMLHTWQVGTIIVN